MNDIRNIVEIKWDLEFKVEFLEFKCEKCQDAQYDSNNPETGGYFWFIPANEFKVMVNGGHSEQSFAP